MVKANDQTSLCELDNTPQTARDTPDRTGTAMPNYLAEIHANDVNLAILGAVVTLVSVGVFFVLWRIFAAVRRRRLAPPDEGRSGPPDDASWEWESPAGLVAEPVPSKVANPLDTVDLDVRAQNANYSRFGVRIEHFDMTSELRGSSSVVETGAPAPNKVRPGRLAASISTIKERGKRICGSAWDQLRHKASPRKIAPLAYAADPGLNFTAQMGEPDGAMAPASAPVVRRPIGLVLRLGLAVICLAAPIGYATTRQTWVESAPAISQAQSQTNRDLSHPLELPANVELLGPDLTAKQAQAGTDRGQAAAARQLADQEHRAAEGERARSAALQGALLESSKQIDTLRASMAAANAREERLRNELAAARTLDALRRIAGDARTLVGEATSYVFKEMPAAHLEQQQAQRQARDLSQARAQIEQLETDAAKDRAAARASLAQASGMLDDERRRSEQLRGDLAEAKLANAALSKRADAAEQELTGAVKARQQVEQTAADAERALARERAAAASAGEELKQARIEREAAEQERTRAVSAKERAEQTTTETAQALARERATAVLNRQDLDKARIERAATQALLLRVAKLQEALDEQREATVSLARDLTAARADNDRLRTERRSAQIEPPAKPRSARAAATGQVKAVSQKTGKVRNPSRVTRVRSITLPYSLLPTYATSQ
ncbi:hypothetical protein [Mesorhizobium sp. B263B2A]|uniref:hypothetical protein n=1 Tax=Mesorhizobium sp. B263B2A TaxID=2876669 RepID=UPI001CD07910|nr:hypothetical protein [Mesorhizobium sp. B263B2A]MCA0031196.1 hypothetical protein [Mesorhizobium sp. B263B2A]